ncbi:hypothetical protein P2R32_21705, partial [Escherichia coli]
DRNRSHWSTSKTPSYTKSVSWQHHPLGLAVMPMVEAAPTAQQQLLEQVRLGEATHREDLVQ